MFAQVRLGAALSNRQARVLRCLAWRGRCSGSVGWLSRWLLGSQAQVKLGALLGSGSYGRMFRATWHGVDVAVKVIEHTCPPILGSLSRVRTDKPSALLEVRVWVFDGCTSATP